MINVDKDWKKFAAQTHSDKDVEKAFLDQAYVFIQNKATPFMKDPYKLGFEIVFKNDSNTRMVGIFAFRVNEELLYAPVFFINGSIKGTDLLYRHQTKKFVPLTNDWCQYMVSLSPYHEGKGIEDDKKANSKDGLSLRKLIFPPNYAGNSAKYASYNEVAELNESLPKAEVVYDELCVKAAEKISDEKDVVKNFILEDGGYSSVDLLKEACLANEEFAVGMIHKVGPDNFMPSELNKEAAERKPLKDVGLHVIKKGFSDYEIEDNREETGGVFLAKEAADECIRGGSILSKIIQNDGQEQKAEVGGRYIDYRYSAHELLKNAGDSSEFFVTSVDDAGNTIVVDTDSLNWQRTNINDLVPVKKEASAKEEKETKRVMEALRDAIVDEKSWWSAGGDISGTSKLKSTGLGALIGALGGGGIGALLGMDSGNYGKDIGVMGGVGALAGGAGGLLHALGSQLGSGMGYNNERARIIDTLARLMNTHAHGDAPGSSNREVYDKFKELASLDDEEANELFDELVEQHKKASEGDRMEKKAFVTNLSDKLNNIPLKTASVNEELLVPGNFYMELEENSEGVSLSEPFQVLEPKEAFSEGVERYEVKDASSKDSRILSTKNTDKASFVLCGEEKDLGLANKHDFEKLTLQGGLKKASIHTRNGFYLIKEERGTTPELTKFGSQVYLMAELGLSKEASEELFDQDKENSKIEFYYTKSAANLSFDNPPDFYTGFDSEFDVPSESPERLTVLSRSTDINDPTSRTGDSMKFDSVKALDAQTPESLMQLSEEVGNGSIFEHGVVGSLAKTYDSTKLIDKYMPDLEDGLDKLGRLIFLFYWKPEDFSQLYGSDDQADLENMLLSNFKSFGDLVLTLLKKTKFNSPGIAVTTQ